MNTADVPDNLQSWGQQPSSSYSNTQQHSQMTNLPPINHNNLCDTEPMNEDFQLQDVQADELQKQQKQQEQQHIQQQNAQRFIAQSRQPHSNILRFPQPPITSIKTNSHAFYPQQEVCRTFFFLCLKKSHHSKMEYLNAAHPHIAVNNFHFEK